MRTTRRRPAVSRPSRPHLDTGTRGGDEVGDSVDRDVTNGSLLPVGRGDAEARSTVNEETSHVLQDRETLVSTDDQVRRQRSGELDGLGAVHPSIAGEPSLSGRVDEVSSRNIDVQVRGLAAGDVVAGVRCHRPRRRVTDEYIHPTVLVEVSGCGIVTAAADVRNTPGGRLVLEYPRSCLKPELIAPANDLGSVRSPAPGRDVEVGQPVVVIVRRDAVMPVRYPSFWRVA